jgi:hypothetical protein
MEEKEKKVTKIDAFKNNVQKVGMNIGEVSKNMAGNVYDGISNFLSKGRESDADVRKKAFDNIDKIDSDIKKEAFKNLADNEYKLQKVNRVHDTVVAIALIVGGTIVGAIFAKNSSS